MWKGDIMLINVSGHVDEAGTCTLIKDAAFPEPFVSGLQYNAPARGVWNIVHVGMLIPKSHQIYVCAANCLRGVVLTAAEMGTLDRFSTIAVQENNVLEGDMEELIIEGVSDILNKLPQKPPAVLIFTACIHYFMGCDLELVYTELRKRYPDVTFMDCYMDPIMRKSGLTPDEKMKRQLYSILQPMEINKKSINIIGNNIPTDESSELIRIIRENGYELKDITFCKTYDEYLNMAESCANISYLPVAIPGGDYLQDKLGQKHLHLPLCYGFDEITKNLNTLREYLGLPKKEYADEKSAALNALKEAKKVIGGSKISIDYTSVPRPCGLARLLVENGFNVDRLYADSFTKWDKTDFDWLVKNKPDIKVYATVHAKMGVLDRKCSEKSLAIGQKAAYFTGSEYFVNIVEGGGMYGFDGIARLAGLMKEAFTCPKDVRKLIQIKGWRCGCCL
ncbi:nitrogenase component 1 [Clostridium ljungdahlii]|nr:nitrogenase component 1 [Clostridium ljungdahlii]